MIIIPFRGQHVEALADLSGQAWMAAHFEDQDPRALEGLGPAFSGVARGELIGCAGLIMCHAQRAIAWAMFSEASGQHFTAIHRAVRRFLAEQQIARIEAHVDCDFSAALRWVRALGFVQEIDRMQKFMPDGRDASMWVRVK